LQVRARYDDYPHAHVAIAIPGPTSYGMDSVAMLVAQTVIGSWNRTHSAGKNLASKLASLNAEFGAAQSFEAFYHKHSDCSLWCVVASLCAEMVQTLYCS